MLWLQNFKDWVLKADDRKSKFKVCKTTIELSNIGEGAQQWPVFPFIIGHGNSAF